MRRVHINAALTTLMDYCTPAVLRERRLHRRLAVHRRHRHQRLAAAVPGPEQQSSTAGRTASGTRSSPACRARPRSRSRTRRTRRSRPTPSRARSRSSTSTRTATTTSSSRPRSPTRRARRGRAGQTPGRSLPIDELLRREADRQRPVDQQRARARQEPDLHAGRLRHRPDDRGQAAPTRSCSGSAWRRSRRRTASSR